MAYWKVQPKYYQAKNNLTKYVGAASSVFLLWRCMQEQRLLYIYTVLLRKTSKILALYCSYQPLGGITTNSEIRPHSPNINHCPLLFLLQPGSHKSPFRGWVPKLGQLLSRNWTNNLLIPSALGTLSLPYTILRTTANFTDP